MLEFDVTSGIQTVFGIVNGGTPGGNWEYVLDANGTTLGWFVMTGASFPSVTKTISASTTYHVYVEYNSATGNLGMSVDNETLQTTALGGTPNASGQQLYVGAWLGLGRYMNGYVDELKIWRGRVLSEAQRTRLYNSGIGIGYPG